MLPMLKRYDIINYKLERGKEMEEQYFFTSGRTELGGNHTDHQGGCVLGAGVSLGMTAAAKRNGTDLVRVCSDGFGEIEIDIGETSPRPEEAGTSASLVRGVCDCFLQSGNAFGGFDAHISSEIPVGSGLSSSAAFEVLIGKIISGLYFENTIPPLRLAQFGQRAENEFFGKPCGLMDQLICSVGGVVFADFSDPELPEFHQISYDFSSCGYRLAIIESGADHSHLTGDYAKIPKDMCLIAQSLGHRVLSEADEAEFLSQFPILREKYGEVPSFRAFHYFEETRRAKEEAEALTRGDFIRFLGLFRESAESSEKYLKNVVSENEPEHRLKKAIDLAREILGGDAAVRVHGGGFAGTAQAFVPEEAVDRFTLRMENAGFHCIFPDIV